MVNDRLLIDFPCDSLVHMQRYGLNFNGVKNVIITHGHQDHFYPEDLLFHAPPFSDGKTSIDVYGDEKVGILFQNTIEEYDAKRWHVEDWVHFNYLKPYAPIVLDGITVTAMLANHDKKEDCYIYLLEQDGKRMLYGHDTGFFPEQTNAYIHGKYFNLMSLDCTMLMLPDGHNHMGLEDDYQLVDQLTKWGCCDANTKIVINHFSHNGELVHDEIVEKVQSHGFHVAYDGYSIEV